MAREGYIVLNYATAAASRAKGQMENTHYRGWGARQQAEKRQWGRSIRYPLQRYVLPKNATEGGSSCALNRDEHKPILSLLLPSSNLSRTVPQPSILNCQSFKKLATCCCCVVLAHRVQSLPSPLP